MAPNRIYLDAQGGQRPSPFILDNAAAMANLSWNDGKSRHHEATEVASAGQIAISTLANHFQVPTNQVLPVHRLGNVFDLLAKMHPETAVSSVARKGALQSFSGRKLSVDRNGRVNEFSGIESFLVPGANQETGVIENISDLISKTGARAIVDATEWVGRTEELPPGDILIARASSWGGPISTCFVISRSSTFEFDQRKVLSLAPDNFELLWAASAIENLEDKTRTEQRIRNYSSSIRKALENYEEITIHGDKHALGHLISFDIKNIDSETAAITFDKAGIAVGSGSACAVAASQSSHVLAEMGIQSSGNVRLSIPLDFSDADLDFFLSRLPEVIASLSQTL